MYDFGINSYIHYVTRMFSNQYCDITVQRIYLQLKKQIKYYLSYIDLCIYYLKQIPILESILLTFYFYIDTGRQLG